MVGDNRSISSNGFRFARMDTKQLKPEFGYSCYAVYGTDYSIASVNEFSGMTENYSRSLKIILLGRRSIT